MKSRITIEVDFEQGNEPVIQIIQRHSDDVRDRLISSFLQRLQHDSSWCTIKWEYYAPPDAEDKHARIIIRALSPDQIKKLIKGMLPSTLEIENSELANDEHKSFSIRGAKWVLENLRLPA